MTTEPKEFMSLSNDLLFKETFANIDNRKYLIYFLSCFTDFSYEYLSQIKMVVKYESILNKTKYFDKAYRGDVVIEFANYKINLECYSNFNEASFKKSTTYVMRIFSTQTSRGKNNYNIYESVIQLNFIDNVVKSFPNELEFTYKLLNAKTYEDTILSDAFVIKCFRLDKARELQYNLDNKKLLWLKFIGAKSAKERKEIAKGDELLMELDNWIEKYVNDKETQEIFGKWAEKIAEDKGIEKGRKEGKQEANLITAKKMLELNIPPESIEFATGLSLEEIEALKN